MFQFNIVKNDVIANKSGTMSVGSASWEKYPHAPSSLLSKVARKNQKNKYGDGLQMVGKDENGVKWLFFERKGSMFNIKNTLICSIFPVLADMRMLASLYNINWLSSCYIVYTQFYTQKCKVGCFSFSLLIRHTDSII